MIINPYESTSLQAAKLWIEHQPRGHTVGLTSGTFDLFHDFHLRYLLRCRRECDILIVGVDSDAAVRRVKGPSRPLTSEFQRVMLLNSNKLVTFAYIQDGLWDFTNVAMDLLGVRGGKVFKNQDFAGRESEVATGKLPKSGKKAVEVVIIPDIDELASTSEIVNRAHDL